MAERAEVARVRHAYPSLLLLVDADIYDSRRPGTGIGTCRFRRRSGFHLANLVAVRAAEQLAEHVLRQLVVVVAGRRCRRRRRRRRRLGLGDACQGHGQAGRQDDQPRHGHGGQRARCAKGGSARAVDRARGLSLGLQLSAAAAARAWRGQSGG